MSKPSLDDQEMPLIAHLTELRKRLLRSVIAIGLVFAGLFYFSQQIYALVAAPLRAYLPEGATMIATGVASPFLTPFKLTLMVALFVSMPIILYQIWGFIAPGLYKHEKRIAVPLLISSIFLFYAGMAFAYFVVFPIMFGFFASVTPEGVAMMTDIGQYLDFVLTLFFAFGVAFAQGRRGWPAAGFPVHPGGRHPQRATAELFQRGAAGAWGGALRLPAQPGVRTARTDRLRALRRRYAGLPAERRAGHLSAGKLAVWAGSSPFSRSQAVAYSRS